MKALVHLFIFCFGLAISVNAQQKSRADKLYDQLAYIKALPYYLADFKKNKDDAHAIERIALCYYHLNNSVETEKYLQILDAQTDLNEEQSWLYAWALAGNNKSDSAFDFLKQYHKLHSKSLPVSGKDHYTKELDIIKNRSFLYVSSLTKFNTEKTDYAPTYYGEDSLKQVAFVSARPPSTKFITRKHGWDMEHFHNIYIADDKKQDPSVNLLSEKISSSFHEGPLVFSENKMYFTANNLDKNKKFVKDADGFVRLKIYESTKKDSGKWTQPTALSFNNDAYSVAYPALSKDGKTMIFASDMPGGKGGFDLYKTTFKNGAWATPSNLGDEINTSKDELFPYLAAEGHLYFSSNGHMGLGGLDLYKIFFDEGAFCHLVNLGGSINSVKDELGLIVDQRNESGYFASNRKEDAKDDDIYSFLVKIRPLLLKGICYDQVSKQTLGQATIILKDKEGNKIDSVETKADGKFSFVIPSKDAYFFLNGQRIAYYEKQDPVDLSALTPETSIVEQDVYLQPAGVTFFGNITQKGTKNSIEGAKVELINQNPNTNLYTHTTLSDGAFKYESEYKFGDVPNFKVLVAAPGYLSKEAIFNRQIKEGESMIDLSQELDLALTKIEKGVDIGKAININPIYFDLDKSNIRKDAALELDKIVKVMNENPSIVIELGSHTDCRASKAYNKSLSSRRAKSSAKYIQQRINDPKRIYGKGYGESQLVNDCACEGKQVNPCSEQQHQMNRRTEFKIVRM